MKVNTYATFAHYADHMQPIVEALRAHGVEVNQYTSRDDVEWGERLHPALTIRKPCDFWMIAGGVDYRSVPGPLIYCEHGAGQTYEADERGVGHTSYSTGRLDRVALYLTPNLFTYHRRRRAHPEAAARLVGYPKLDHLHAHATGAHEGVRTNVVAFAWHWDCQLVPETNSAFPYYQHDLRHLALRLRRAGYTPVMTAHPRIARRVSYHAERSGFEVWDSDDVLHHAAVLVADNTSLMYEFASLDRPVVAINAPTYRKDVHHGMRFWEAVPGEQVDAANYGEEHDFGPLLAAIGRAFEHDPWSDRRATVNALVCPVRDGRAAERSALAVLQLR